MARVFLSFVAVFFLFSSCLEELGQLDNDFQFEQEPELAYPVVDSRLVIDDFSDEIDDVTIESEADGTVVLSYSTDIFEEIAETYFSISSQTSPIVNISGLSSGGVPLTGTLSASAGDVMVVDPDNNERLDLVRLKGGTIRLRVNSSYTVTTSVTFDIPNLLMGGSPFVQQMDIVPGTNFFDIPINTATVNLTLDGMQFNQLAFNVDLLLTANGDQVTSGQSLEAFFRIIDPEIQFLVGESDARVIETQTGTEPIDVLSDISFDDFVLEEPALQLEVRNSFGVPFEIDLTSLTMTDVDDQNYTLTGTIIDDPIMIGAPTVTGQSAITNISVDGTNSNLSDFLGGIPKELSYAASASYPGGNAKIFVLDTSKVKLSGGVRLPLYGSVMNLVVDKEFDFDGSVLEDLSEGSLVLDISNRFPLELSLTLQFLDDLDNTLVELLTSDPVLVPAAPVDGDGRSTAEELKSREIVLQASDLEQMQNATKIRALIGLETSGGGSQSVRILETDFMDLKIGIKAKVKL